MDGAGVAVFIYATVSDFNGKEVWTSGEPVKVAAGDRLLWTRNSGPAGKPIVLPGAKYNLAVYVGQLEPNTKEPRLTTEVLISRQVNPYFGYGDNCKKATPPTPDPSAAAGAPTPAVSTDPGSASPAPASAPASPPAP